MWSALCRQKKARIPVQDTAKGRKADDDAMFVIFYVLVYSSYRQTKLGLKLTHNEFQPFLLCLPFYGAVGQDSAMFFGRVKT